MREERKCKTERVREWVHVQRNSKRSVESDNRLCLVIVWENTHTTWWQRWTTTWDSTKRNAVTEVEVLVYISRFRSSFTPMARNREKCAVICWSLSTPVSWTVIKMFRVFQLRKSELWKEWKQRFSRFRITSKRDKEPETLQINSVL